MWWWHSHPGWVFLSQFYLSWKPSTDLSRVMPHRRFKSSQLDKEDKPSMQSFCFAFLSSRIDALMYIPTNSDQGFLLLQNLGRTSVLCSLVVHNTYWNEVVLLLLLLSISLVASSAGVLFSFFMYLLVTHTCVFGKNIRYWAICKILLLSLLSSFYSLNSNLFSDI